MVDIATDFEPLAYYNVIMRSWKSLLAAVTFACAGTLVGASQCQATLNTAIGVANRLQSEYFNTANGQYTGGSLWTDAVKTSNTPILQSSSTDISYSAHAQNTLEDLHNLMLASGTDQYSAVADESFIGRSALNPNTNWASLLGGSNDDAGIEKWVVLSLWKMADYKANRGLSNTAYLNAASTIYDIIAGQWDSTCGGGVWWSTAHTYKNAITNELFLLLSAQGYLRNKNLTYLENARKGVIASGLAYLFAATGNSTLLDQAEITLDATMQHLTAGTNILKESCDDAQSGGPVCNQDQGVWTKHLQYYLDMAGPARVGKYSAFLGSQESAVFHFGTNANDDVGSVWYAPNQGGSIFTPKTSASGLAAHVAAAKYGPC
ncbi:hypothetical protein JR316_0001539 [Psilocybe cubensis]|uniref:Uncharacterized protein n=2 Tax=Psilocybe cubensis TaxID=181762 RepID=A0ACB8HHR1_PSICU|nr:hypothetical protein JR316_0001539 [Psilocybe cubensis]KAH9487463.1 hypothetical protein JR316_0001539 [Psilocybe cubensis]